MKLWLESRHLEWDGGVFELCKARVSCAFSESVNPMFPSFKTRNRDVIVCGVGY